MTMEELLDELRGHAEWEGVGDYADRIAAVFGDTVSGSEATINEVNTALEEQRNEIQRLQAENYKLMTALGSAAKSDEPAKEPDHSDEDEPELIDINDYIKEE